MTLRTAIWLALAAFLIFSRVMRGYTTRRMEAMAAQLPASRRKAIQSWVKTALMAVFALLWIIIVAGWLKGQF
jgi:hypothetical protein